jgi:bacterioferritin (cytochrome b1)
MKTTTTVTTGIETLNTLLRGELSAIETYRLGLEKVGDDPGGQELHGLLRDHRDAADRLWHHIERHEGRPAESSGPWGGWAKLVQGTANLLGDAAALKALKEGEEHGLKDYEEALHDEGLPEDSRELVRELMARQRQHIATLDRLIDLHLKR